MEKKTDSLSSPASEMTDKSNEIARRPRARLIIVEIDDPETNIAETFKEIVEPMQLPPHLTSR